MNNKVHIKVGDKHSDLSSILTKDYEGCILHYFYDPTERVYVGFFKASVYGRLLQYYRESVDYMNNFLCNIEVFGVSVPVSHDGEEYSCVLDGKPVATKQFNALVGLIRDHLMQEIGAENEEETIKRLVSSYLAKRVKEGKVDNLYPYIEIVNHLKYGDLRDVKACNPFDEIGELLSSIHKLIETLSSSSEKTIRTSSGRLVKGLQLDGED